MKKIGICGHFGVGLNLSNGQTIKTRIITGELKKLLGEEEVMIVDTHGGAKRVPGMVIDTFRAFRECESIMILPAHKGLKLFVPMCTIFNKFFHRKLFYNVIGGWLDSMIAANPYLLKGLKQFTSICVETSTMKNALMKRGLENVSILRNCKQLRKLTEDNLSYQAEMPYRLCTFSTIMKEKGIEDIVNAVTEINKSAGYEVFRLDLYGNIYPPYKEAFEQLLKEVEDYIQYKGCVAFDQSVETLKDYFALVFPTRFYTEGIPGTIIDAYASGLPVISSRWESFSDVVEEGVTGLGYEFGDEKALKELLLEIAEKPSLILTKKKDCLERAEQYMPDYVIGRFIKDNL